MRIGIFDPYLDTLGGGEKYMLTIAECLASKNKVSILWDHKASELKERATNRFGFDFTKISFAKNIFAKGFPLFKRIQAAQQYDAIIYLSDGSIPLTFARNLIIHFQFPVEWVNGNSLKTKLKLLQVKNVICNSFFTKSYIDRKFSIKSQIVYPPVETPQFHIEKKENVILHVGRFGMDLEGANYKKQDVMIDVFKKMVGDGLVEWRFALIISVNKNDKSKVGDLRNKAQNFPIDIIENPTKEVLWKMYKKAKIYWHATGLGEDLEKHPEKAEHFGIATAEAMGQGCVPVVINAGGQLEIVEDGNNGFLWNTTDELMQKTKTLIQNVKLQTEMSKESRARVKIFNKERFCEQIEEIIR